MADTPKKFALIVHEAYSHPNDHWYRWLRASLQDQGFAVSVPDFPTPTGQSIQYWDNVLEEHLKSINENTILIGHGIGAAYVLTILSRINTPVRNVFLVAPYYQSINHLGFDQISKTFYEFPYNWEIIKSHAGSFTVYHSPKDPYVPPRQVKDLIEKLGASQVAVSDAEHFYANSGYDAFPEILADIVAKDTYTAPTGEEALAQELAIAGVPTKKISPDEPSVETAATVLETPAKAPITTYYKDLSTAISSAEAGQLAKLLREEREEKASSKQRQKLRISNMLQITAVIILIGLGIFALTRVALPTTEFINEDIRAENFFTTESQSFISIDGLDTTVAFGDTLLAERNQLNLATGQFHDIILTRTILGRTERLRARSLFSTIDTMMPALLKQDLGTHFMYGFYQDKEPEPFLLFTVDSFHRAKNNLEDWEQTLVADLEPLLHVDTSQYFGEEGSTFTENYYNNILTRELTLNQITEVLQVTFANTTQPTPGELVPDATSVAPSEAVQEDSIEAFAEDTSLDETPFTPPTFVSPTADFGAITTITQLGNPETILLYGFIRDDLFVITTSHNALDAIIRRLPTGKLL